MAVPISFGSKTQQVHAMSSAEAGLYAICTRCSELLFARNVLEDCGFAQKLILKIHTDSSAGKSMAVRFGASKKSRHIQLRFLFVQHLVRAGVLKVQKIKGNENPADVFTKYVSVHDLSKHLSAIGIGRRSEFLIMGLCICDLYRVSDEFSIYVEHHISDLHHMDDEYRVYDMYYISYLYYISDMYHTFYKFYTFCQYISNTHFHISYLYLQKMMSVSNFERKFLDKMFVLRVSDLESQFKGIC
jgi:hypothetical protein